MNPFLQVAIGGAIGATCRFALYRLMPLAWQATLLVNVLGSFAMGLLAAAFAHRFGNGWAPLLLTGVLGGFTTFSAFSLDVVTLWERGQGAAAFALFGVVTMQAVLGVVTLVHAVPLSLGVLHQAGAAVVRAVATWNLWLVRRSQPRLFVSGPTRLL